MKNRLIYLFVVFVIISLGLLSRSELMPNGFLKMYSGDTLWAMMVFFGVSFLNPSWTIKQRFLIALCFSFGIELLQLYQADWINEIRYTRLGGLILGFGFLWVDLLCYTVGVMMAFYLDKHLRIKDD